MKCHQLSIGCGGDSQFGVIILYGCVTSLKSIWILIFGQTLAVVIVEMSGYQQTNRTKRTSDCLSMIFGYRHLLLDLEQ